MIQFNRKWFVLCAARGHRTAALVFIADGNCRGKD